jgi:hypothetical protein
MMDKKTASEILELERVKLAGLTRFNLAEEAKLRDAREALGISPEPKATEDEPVEARDAKPLGQQAQAILLIHLREDSSSLNLLATKCGQGKLGLLDSLAKQGFADASDSSVRRAQRELQSRNYLSPGKKGPGGGCYITSLGKRMALKIQQSR